jgi:hypothetical protein
MDLSAGEIAALFHVCMKGPTPAGSVRRGEGARHRAAERVVVPYSAPGESR